MAIRRREKPLTPSEAIELTKREFAPYWFGCSEPYMAGIRNESGVQAYPLDSRMTDRAWLIFFIDPFSLAARDCLSYARSWAHRYESQRLGVMVISKLPYAFSKLSEWGHKFSHQFHEPVVSVMDHNGLLHEAFKVETSPKVILLDQSKIALDRSGHDWLANAELDIQRFLRRNDPGLP
jgi:hypothetical protein